MLAVEVGVNGFGLRKTFVKLRSPTTSSQRATQTVVLEGSAPPQRSCHVAIDDEEVRKLHTRRAHCRAHASACRHAWPIAPPGINLHVPARAPSWLRHDPTGLDETKSLAA